MTKESREFACEFSCNAACPVIGQREEVHWAVGLMLSGNPDFGTASFDRQMEMARQAMRAGTGNPEAEPADKTLTKIVRSGMRVDLGDCPKYE